MNSLGKQTAAGSNSNLTAIRLMLAIAIILAHALPISLGLGGEATGDPLGIWKRLEAFGVVAVNLFFFISGMSITASWLRSKSMQDFFMKRVLRIYPGFIVAVGFSGALIWTFCPEFRAGAGNGISWLNTFVRDLLFLSSKSLGWKGTFAGNPYPDAANGSLWTIVKEFSLLLACSGDWTVVPV